MHARPLLDRVRAEGRLERVAKFATVGASGFVVNVLAFAALVQALWYLPAAILSWLAANVTSYNLNRRFTFRDTETDYLRGYARHLSVYLVGLVAYGTALVALSGVSRGVLAIAVASATAGVTNFVGSELWVFDP